MAQKLIKLKLQNKVSNTTHNNERAYYIYKVRKYPLKIFIWLTNYLL